MDGTTMTKLSEPVREGLAILLGLLTTVITASLVALVIVATGFVPTSFMLFFFLPVAAILIGLAAGAGIPIGLRILQARPTAVSKVAGAVLGLVCFALVYFTLYNRTYVDANDEINYSGKGDHIGEFVDVETGEPITFARFVQLDVEGRSSAFFGSSRREDRYERLGLGSTVNWLKFALEGVGLMVGGFAVASYLADEAYCARCRRYMKSRELTSVPLAVFPAVWERLETAVHSAAELEAIALDAPKADQGQPYVRLDLAWCELCLEGNVLARSFTEKSPVGFNEAGKERLALPLSPFVIEAARRSAAAGD
jgi:hypothetical protein